jgi:molybdopterin-guanine dinucleotide biosynthesis protein A
VEKAISDCCNHNDKGREKAKRFVYNPFEIGVVVPRGPERERLLAGLLNRAFPGRRPALATRGLKALTDDESRELGTQCVDNGRQRVIVHTTDADEYTNIGPLIDADFVLAADDHAQDLPALVYLDKPEPPAHPNVLAYVGKESLCPQLPSSATYFADSDAEKIGAFVLAHFAKQSTARPIHGLILTGGFSTRMKRDKAQIEYHGTTQVEHCASLLRTVCTRVFVSCRSDQANEPHLRAYEQVHDTFIGYGPMGGILSAQKQHPNAAWLILACDLPFVDADTLENLVAQRDPFKLATAYIGTESNLPEPLCAVYEPKSMHRLLAFLGKGYHCPRKVLINSDTHLLTLPNPHALDNANSPEEYEAALATLGRNGA